MTFASMKDEFGAIGCSLLGLSVDSNPSHIAWARAMEKYQWKNIKDAKITFPIIADDFGIIAKMYGMLMPTASATKTVRSVFIIDPSGTIRAILIYPLTTGRNLQEIKRLVIALQAFDATGNPTPCNWVPSEEQVSPAPQTLPESQKRLDGQHANGYYCLDWYICFVKDNKHNPQIPSMPIPVPMPVPAPLPKPIPTPYTIPQGQAANMAATVMPSVIMPENAGNNMIMNEMPIVMPKSIGSNTMNEIYKANTPSDYSAQMKKTENATPEKQTTKTQQTMPIQQSAPTRQVEHGKKDFTVAELAKYNGKMGMSPYGAVNGVVYDFTSVASLPEHAALKFGTDLTKEFIKCHMGMTYLLSKYPVMGTLASSSIPAADPNKFSDYMITRDYPSSSSGK